MLTVFILSLAVQARVQAEVKCGLVANGQVIYRRVGPFDDHYGHGVVFLWDDGDLEITEITDDQAEAKQHFNSRAIWCAAKILHR